MLTDTLHSHKDWFANSFERRQAFLKKHHLLSYSLTPISGDAAPRFYYRLQDQNSSYVLLESAPDSHPQSFPGHRLDDFLIISQRLYELNLSSPRVFEADLEAGYLLLEDFGHLGFKEMLTQNPGMEAELYGLGIDVLAYLRDQGQGVAKDRALFEDGYHHQARRQFADWFMPYYLGRAVNRAELEAFHSAFEKIEQPFLPYPKGLMYVDFHIENLMFLPQRDGMKQCGLLDFTGICLGPPAFDIAHFTMDARRTITPEMRDYLIRRYTQNLSSEERAKTTNLIPILGLHFHIKVIGQIIRWVCEGKTAYLQHLNRVINYVLEALANEQTLFPFQHFLNEQGIDLTKPLPPPNPHTILPNIAEDAFLRSRI